MSSGSLSDMIVTFTAPLVLLPPPAATVQPASSQAVSRTNIRLPRVEQVASISPWRPRGNQSRVGGEDRLGGFGTAGDTAYTGARRGGFSAQPDLVDASVLPMAGSLRFLAQVFGQESGHRDAAPLVGHRDGPNLGSQAYRRAGADPEFYSEDSALIRFAV